MKLFVKMGLFLFLLLSTMTLPIEAVIREKPGEPPRKIVALTIPKAGTHLLINTIPHITGRKAKWFGGYEANPHVNLTKHFQVGDPSIQYNHLFPSFDCIKNDHTGRFRKVILIRDLRDVLLAQISWINEEVWKRWAPHDFVDEFNAQPFDEQLNRVIDFPDEYYSIKYFANLALEWMKEPDVFVCRFEDLVGSEGGGDKEVQEKAIFELADFLGYTMDPEDVQKVAESIFGGTRTFRKGQINRWRSIYKPEHVEFFKEKLGQELIDLGYESDNNW